MGDFSRSTFDRVKHYVGVRLQQGVPLVDADWNESEDIRRYEVQAFLKWFVGDGVPAGNEGFRIAALAGGGVNTIRLTQAGTPTGRSSVTVDIAASTAAAALGFTIHNRQATRFGAAARLTGDAAQPFPLAAGMTLVVGVEGGPPETVTFAAASFANIAAATAAEVVTAINAAVTRVVASAGTGEDFVILGGDGSPENAGRCLVDGRDAVHEGRLAYTSQPLFGNAVLAAEWNVPALPALSPPGSGSRTDLVYLDVWDREVTAAEDDSLINPLIGVESCVRLRREWTVRVRTGTLQVPISTDPDFRAGHSYLRLAQLARQAGVPAIQPAALVDLRARNLLVPPSTLIEDVLGITPDAYRRGESRPPISLREAINALLRGELPGSADTAVAPATAVDFMSTAFLVAGGTDIVAIWHSRRAANVNQIFLTRWPVRSPAAAATNLPVQVTPGPTPHAAPSAVQVPGGDIVLVYETNVQDIHARRGAPSGLPGATEFTVAASSLVERQPYAVVTGDLVVFFWQQTAAGNIRTWQYRRWRHTDSTFVDVAGPLQLSATQATALSGGIGDFSPAVDSAGDVWAAFRADDGGGASSIRLVRLRPTSGQVEEQLVSTGTANEQPFVLVDGTDTVWVFWRGGVDPNTSVSYQRIPVATWPAAPPPPTVAVSGASAARPAAIRDTDGAVWLLWSQLVGTTAVRAIFQQRFVRTTNTWGAPRQVTASTTVDDQPLPVAGPFGGVLLFWISTRTGNIDLFSKQLITAV